MLEAPVSTSHSKDEHDLLDAALEGQKLLERYFDEGNVLFTVSQSKFFTRTPLRLVT